MLKTSLKKRLPALTLLALAACVDGDGPTGPGVPVAVSIAARPSFALEPSTDEIEKLDRARITLTHVPNDSVLVSHEEDIDPDSPEWTFELTLQLSSEQVLDVKMDIELIDADVGVGLVEWSGRTTFDVQASFEPQEIRVVNLGRGPLENLSLTRLDVSGARSRIQEGGSDFLVVDTAGGQAGQVLYYRTTNPMVASVDSIGNISALVPGETRIIARAGRVADTLNLTVGQVNLPSPQVLQARVVPQMDYVRDDLFLGTLADPVVALAIRDALDALASEMLAGRGFEAVGRFEDSAELWEGYGEGTDLRFLDGPQLGVIAIALMHAADALGIDFL